MFSSVYIKGQLDTCRLDSQIITWLLLILVFEHFACSELDKCVCIWRASFAVMPVAKLSELVM